MAEAQRACHQAFSLRIPYALQKDIDRKRVPGTCNWVLKHKTYLDWRDNDDSKLLWIFADPGCGKTSSCIVNEDLQSLQDKGVGVLYVFFVDAGEEQNSISGALSAVLHQLFSILPALIRLALPDFGRYGSGITRQTGVLWSIFTRSLSEPECGDLICVFDALDEAQEPERTVFLEDIKALCRSSDSKQSRVKFLITSRPNLELRSQTLPVGNPGISTIFVEEQEMADIMKEIRLVIRYEVDQLNGMLTPDLRIFLEKSLSRSREHICGYD